MKEVFNPSFVHLRLHTAYSLLEGALKIPQVVELCKAHEMPAVAITDTNNMFGALEFSMACAKNKIQPILGLEIGVGLPAFKEQGGVFPSIVLIAQNENGYRHLIKLISQVYAELPQRHTPHVTYEDLARYSEGVIALSGAAKGPVGSLFLNNKIIESKETIQAFHRIFGDRFYMEIQRHGLDIEDKTEEFFIEEAYTHHIPLVATNNCFFADASLYEAHDALLCVAAGSYVNEENRRRESPHHFFKSQKEMVDLFQDLPEAIHNTVAIMERCSFMPEPAPKPLLPPFRSESGRNEEDELRRQADAGLNDRLAHKSVSEVERTRLIQLYKERLEYEIGVIVQMGFAGYFLIVSDFIKWAKSQKIPVGPGRGSGAGS
jgi:DNA polymerase-3 subunit alpha